MKFGLAGLLVVVGAVLVGAGMQYGGWNSAASGVPKVSAVTVGLPTVPSATVVDGELQRVGMQTVTLNVDGMYCPSCGYIVHEALMSTPGVVAAKVEFGRAEVTFDPSKADLAEVIAATGKYGYPAELVSG